MHCVDLGESFPTSIYLQKSASIQPRTSPSKVGGKFNSLFICLLIHDVEEVHGRRLGAVQVEDHDARHRVGIRERVLQPLAELRAPALLALSNTDTLEGPLVGRLVA